MNIGTDPSGKVLLVGDCIPTQFNGVAITVRQLTAAQQAAYLALPAARAGAIFDGETFTIIPLPAPTPEELRLADIDTVIGADATIAQLKAMTSPEFDAWWAANVTNLAQANNVLKRIARVVLRKLC